MRSPNSRIREKTSQLTPDLHWDLGSKAWRYKQIKIKNSVPLILLILKSIHKDWGMLSKISWCVGPCSYYESWDPCFVVINKLNAPISSDGRNFRIQFYCFGKMCTICTSRNYNIRRILQVYTTPRRKRDCYRNFVKVICQRYLRPSGILHKWSYDSHIRGYSLIFWS